MLTISLGPIHLYTYIHMYVYYIYMSVILVQYCEVKKRASQNPSLFALFHRFFSTTLESERQ